MKLARYLAVALAAALTPSCFIYPDSLVEGEAGSGGEGNGSNGGTGNTDGGGGTGNSGNTTGGGGTGGGGTGGDGGSGGSGSTDGGGGTGGGPSVTLVDDLEEGLPAYFNPPFNGNWKREGQTMTASPVCSAAVWTEAAIGDMIQEDPDDADNLAFHVQATALDCWGVDIYLTLKDSGTPEDIDVAAYTGLRFRARRINAEGTLKVALEDTASNYTAGNCGGASPSVDCNKHAVSAAPTTLTADWRLIEVPLSSFGTASASGARSVPLDPTQVYAIHFTLDPTGTEADFWIDDVEFYTE